MYFGLKGGFARTELTVNGFPGLAGENMPTSEAITFDVGGAAGGYESTTEAHKGKARAVPATTVRWALRRITAGLCFSFINKALKNVKRKFLIGERNECCRGTIEWSTRDEKKMS